MEAGTPSGGTGGDAEVAEVQEFFRKATEFFRMSSDGVVPDLFFKDWSNELRTFPEIPNGVYRLFEKLYVRQRFDNIGCRCCLYSAPKDCPLDSLKEKMLIDNPSNRYQRDECTKTCLDHGQNYFDEHCGDPPKELQACVGEPGHKSERITGVKYKFEKPGDVFGHPFRCCGRSCEGRKNWMIYNAARKCKHANFETTGAHSFAWLFKDTYFKGYRGYNTILAYSLVEFENLQVRNRARFAKALKRFIDPDEGKVVSFVKCASENDPAECEGKEAAMDEYAPRILDIRDASETGAPFSTTYRARVQVMHENLIAIVLPYFATQQREVVFPDWLR